MSCIIFLGLDFNPILLKSNECARPLWFVYNRVTTWFLHDKTYLSPSSCCVCMSMTRSVESRNAVCKGMLLENEPINCVVYGGNCLIRLCADGDEVMELIECRGLVKEWARFSYMFIPIKHHLYTHSLCHASPWKRYLIKNKY